MRFVYLRYVSLQKGEVPMHQEVVPGKEEDIDLRTLALKLRKAELSGDRRRFESLLRGQEETKMPDQRIVILFASSMGLQAVGDMFGEGGLSEIETLDFLMGQFDDRADDNGFEVIEASFGYHDPFAYALSVIGENIFSGLPMAMPLYLVEHRGPHYRDLEYPRRSRRSQIKQSRRKK